MSSGRGWAAWGRRDTLGQVSLIAVGGHGVPLRLPVRPLRRLDGLDVGAGPVGGPAVVYRGCRESVCGYFRFALPDGPEVRLRVPGPPRGCRQEHPVIARRLFVARWPRQAGRRDCRAGIYELRGRRFVLRHPAVGVESVDVERGRLAVASFGRDEIVRIVVRRLRGGTAQLVARNAGALSDNPTSYQLSWDTGTLWMGLTESGSDGVFGHAMRVRWTPRPVCTIDPRTYQTEQVAVQWAFVAGRVLYTDGLAGTVRAEGAQRPAATLRARPLAVRYPAAGALTGSEQGGGWGGWRRTPGRRRCRAASRPGR